MKKSTFIIMAILAPVFVSCNCNSGKTQANTETTTTVAGVTDSISKITLADEPKNEVVVNELVSKEGKTLVAEYAEKDGKRVVNITYENQPAETLTQTSAWAKGAEYENEKMKWEAQGDNGKLTVNGKTTAFSLKKQG